MGISFPLPRLAGVSTVMRCHPSRPKDINATSRGSCVKVRGDCTRYGRLVLFNLREVPLCFSHPTLCINQKQLITIWTMRPLDG